MRIGVLYESDEWSDHKLASELARAFGEHARVQMVDMMRPDAVEQALTCQLLVSRVFASAVFRGHGEAHGRMEELIRRLEGAPTRLVNPPRAHAFEVDKVASSEALAVAGVPVPKIHAAGCPADISLEGVAFPVVIKPACGGRTTQTCIARTIGEAQAFLNAAADIPFLVQEHIDPVRGFVTRVEIVAGEPTLIVKRSVVGNGLSAYRFGSTYAPYPDCPVTIREAATQAAAALGFFFGSFDVIEGERGAFFIDANSVSNASEDCTELFGRDLLREYADALACAVQGKAKEEGGR